MKTTPDKAFKRAQAGYEVFGKKLFPFSSMRQGVAASMGMRFGLVDQSDIFTITIEDLKGPKKSRDVQFYNQLYSDVVKVLWLCMVTESRVLRAERRIDEAKIEASRWADANGISLFSERYFTSAATFFQMMQDIAVVRGEPKSKRKTDDEEDDSPND